jgi:predicted Fe-Mo cluster-binding NifX family protein
MKIAISAKGSTLRAEIDPRFGRCQHFIIVDPETKEFEALDNTNTMATGGAGISTGQMIASKGVEAVLTGNCGPNAYQVLSSAGVQVITGVSGRVKDAIEEYRSGKFQTSDSANVPNHFGTGRDDVTDGSTGRSIGGGMRMGRGMGRGMGKGMGMGGGIMPLSAPTLHASSLQEEIEALKVQSQELAGQLAEIQHRTEKLEDKQK